MPNNLTIREYYREATLTRDEFTKRFAHPFLVISNTSSDDEDDQSGSFFFTKAFMPLDNPNATLGGGPSLDAGAVVVPVKKKIDQSVHKVSLASTVMVGRNDDNDLVLTYTGISKYHFYIAAQPFTTDQYTISDNGSTNGTFVNMKKVAPSARVPLNSGDKISLGNSLEIRFFLAADFWERLQEIRRSLK